MKKFILLTLVLLLVHRNNLCSQEIDNTFSSKKKITMSLGMGISLDHTPSFNEYLKNRIPYIGSDSIKTFSVGFELFAGLEYGISRNFSVKLDYSYFFKSLRYEYSYFIYDYFYNIHQPSLNVYYLLSGRYHQFKFGLGAGYRFMNLDFNGADYKSGGLGLRGEIVYSAMLSKRMTSYISGFLSGSFTGILKDENGTTLSAPSSGKEVNLNSFGAGLRLGISYIFK